MATKYIIGSILASFAVSYALDNLITEKKIFGGTTPGTVSNKEWGKKPKRNCRHGLVLPDPCGDEPNQSSELYHQIQL